MTVGELIEALYDFDLSINVYVPSMNGKVEIAAHVGPLSHLNLPAGISIPDDVYIVSQDFDEQATREWREG